MSHIAVLGLGNFGTALVRTWLEAGLVVKGWTVEEDVYATIATSQINEKYLPGVELVGLTASLDIAEVVAGAEIVVLAVPSGVVLEVFEQVLPFLKSEQILMDLAKGLAPGDQLISHVISARLAEHGLTNKLCVMMGPTIAPEMARGVLTTALVTCEDRDIAESLATRLSTATLSLSAGTDPIGAEYWGAFKNVIALACGVVDGLKEDGRGGDNLKAAVFTAGYREASRLLPELGAEPSTALSAAGIGDLFVTATSPHGRNREMGERLGKGQSLTEAQGEMVMVSEGVRAARMFQPLFANAGLKAPFVDAVCGLLDGGLTLDAFLSQVMRA
ncbi:MAG: NAD(P)H-dependent glycerol-3-phosphate dehydrogenase [Pseudomonadota bacterium]